MKYLYCKKQHGEGCDYTIGCGMCYGFIEAQSIEEATDSLIYPNGKDEISALEGEMALKEIILIPAEAINIVDVDTRVAEIKEMRKRENEVANEIRELAEFRRLKSKYDK